MINPSLDQEETTLLVENPEAIVMAMPGIEIEIDLDEDEPMMEEAPSIGHGENLAEHVDKKILDSLGSELIDDFESDKKTRSDWEETYVKGLELLGLKIEDRTTPWPGACGVYHPILAEAVIRFQSQTIMECFPSGGPVRTKVVGKSSEERDAQAIRVEEELNYQLTEKMTDYRSEMEQMLFQLPLAGSAFKKVYYDSSLGRAVSAFVPAEDFIVQYGATDLGSCPRVTQIMRMYPNDIRKLQASGFYLDIDLPTPSPEYSNIQSKKDSLTGTSKPSIEYDDRHQILEMHVDYDLEGFEDVDAEGEPTGIGLPYIITIEKTSQKVLSIRRNWDENNERCERNSYFVHYKYLPGLGFYGSGLIHLIGGIAKSSTSILRQLVDAGTLSNLPGGLKSRGLRIKGDDTPIMPGEFRDVDIPGGSIRDNITFLPYKEPSQTLLALLGSLIEEGRRFASIGDLQIGQANQNAPVGTTLALMERAMKVMSSIQARIHASLRQEFQMVANIISEYMPDAYDYEVGEGFSRKEDFDGRIDILPVSDPNSSTMAQRVVAYQAAIQLAASAPNLYDMPVLHRKMLGAMGIGDLDQIIPDKEDIKAFDPVAENMMILTNKPIKAYAYQDHEAHITTHMAAMQDPKIAALVGQSPMAQTISAAAMAHISEHIAFQYKREIEKQLGFELPSDETELPEDMEVSLSQLVSQAASQLLQKDQAEVQMQKSAEQAQDPVIQMQQQDLQIRAAEIQRKSAKDKSDTELGKLREILSLKKEEMRLAAQREIAGAQIGARVSSMKAQLTSKDQIEGTKIGIDMAKALRGTGG